MFYLEKDPKGYFVAMSAGVSPVANKTFVLLKYDLDMPKTEELGITPSKHAPPLAVQIGALQFSKQLHVNLRKVNLPKPRKRTKHKNKCKGL